MDSLMNQHTRLLAIPLCLPLLLAACDDGGVIPPGADAGVTDDGATVFAVGTDYLAPGVASTVGIPSLEVTQGAVAGVASSDPVVRYADGKLVIVNRYGADNVTVLDAGTLSLIAQISTGAGSNPQDAAVKGNKIYVAALASAGILVLDLDTPSSGVVATIDLSSLDPDGVPNCNAVQLVGDTLFAACGILDDEDDFLTPRGRGKIAVIDTSDDSLVDDLQLIHKRPLGRLQATPSTGPLGGDLLVTTVPNFGDLTEGCLERVSTGATPASNGCLVENAALGGYASGYAYDATADRLWLAVTEGWDSEDFGTLGALWHYDAIAGALADEAVSADAHRPGGVTLCPTGHAVTTDSAGGLRVYTPAGAELTTTLLDIGLPPASAVCF
jgi:DNA-binding beta-propeller fold protein YncE